MPVFRECWYRVAWVARLWLWKQRNGLCWGGLRGWWYEGCLECLYRIGIRVEMSSWVVWALNVLRTRSREQGWDSLGMLSRKKRTIGWRNAQGWMWPEWSSDRQRWSGRQRCSEKNMELCGEGHEGCGYKGGNGAGSLYRAWRNITGVRPMLAQMHDIHASYCWNSISTDLSMRLIEPLWA